MENLLGQGSYSIPDAARIVHASSQSIRRWALGYEFGSPEDRHRSAPILLTRVFTVDNEPVLTFKQLIELRFINLFRSHGVSIPVIRGAAQFACELLRSDSPFAAKGLMTDGRHIFMAMSPDIVEEMPEDRVIHDLNLGQTVMAEIVDRYFRQIDYDLSDAIRLWPLGKDRQVVIDPRRSFGMPIDPETGVTTDTLYRMRAAGETESAVADWYRVTEDAVRDAVEYELGLKQNSRQRGLLAA